MKKKRKYTKFIFLVLCCIVLLAAGAFVLFDKGKAASDFMQVEELTRGDDFIKSFLGHRDIKMDIEGDQGSFLSQFNSTLPWSDAMAAFGGEKFIAKQNDEIVLYNKDYKVITKKAISEYLPDTLNWQCDIMVEHSSENTACFRLKKKLSDGEFWSHGILKVSVEDDSLVLKSYDIGKYSCFAVDDVNNRVFVFRYFEKDQIDIYNTDLVLIETIEQDTVNSYSRAIYNAMTDLICLIMTDVDSSKWHTALFSPKEKRIIGTFDRHADGWTQNGLVLLRDGLKLRTYDPKTESYKTIYRCPMTAKKFIRLVTGSDPSLVYIGYDVRNFDGSVSYHRVLIDLLEKEYMHKLRARMGKGVFKVN